MNERSFLTAKSCNCASLKRMSATLVVMVMSSSFFNPSYALSSHFDSDGAPLSELSWSSSLAVVAVSFFGLFTFIFLMLACLCCKKGDIGFKEFENAEGEEYQAHLSTLASPASQSGPEVYILPLTEVSLPVAKQPGRSVQLLKSTDLGRHSLLYLKEIGHGWFGKVLLGELNAGLSSTQVVVKELKASASVQDQMHFLEEAQPYRVLQHPALLQCLAQCTEVTPYLLLLEFCPLGDVKGYLRSCRSTDAVTPDPLFLQRMACEIASGLLHLHKHNFIHSDLALRNCLLTSDLTVKIGDYGLSHDKYKDDYFVTSDQTWVPLRWIAPEVVDEVHGNMLIVDQSKQSNIWSLGVTLWELFELGNQPYRHYSDRQVLTYAVKDQQLKLPRPLLNFPLADRWYEVMQFCWLQPDQRPNAEEVHLLLTYLCAKGASEAEEDFERRWSSMRPNLSHASLHRAGSSPPETAQATASSSFPLLEQFSMGDGYHSESGDDVLTVTETSHGLNFEYKWEQARSEQPCRSASASGTLGQVNSHCQEIYYPPGGMGGGCAVDGLALGVSPSYYEPKQLHTPSVVPVLSAHSPSVGSEYYIRIEEPVNCNVDLDYTMCTYSPDFGGSNGSFLTGSGDSGECINCPSEGKTIDSYWSADVRKTSAYDSDSSPAMSLTMEPLLGQISDTSPIRPWESGHYVSYKDRDGGYYYEHSPQIKLDHYLMGGQAEPPQESWGSRSLRQALGELENPLGISPSLNSPAQDYGDPYLESSQGSIIGKNVTGGYYDMMGSLRKTMPGGHSVCINMESGGAVFIAQEDSDSEEEEDLFVERQGRGWSTNHSANNNSLSLCRTQRSCQKDAYADFHYTMPMTDVEDSWPQDPNHTYHAAKSLTYLESAVQNNTCMVHGQHVRLTSSADCNPFIHICHETRKAETLPIECFQTLDSSHFVDPLTGLMVNNCLISDQITENSIRLSKKDSMSSQVVFPAGHKANKREVSSNNPTQECITSEQYVDIVANAASSKKEDGADKAIAITEPKAEVMTTISPLEKPISAVSPSQPESDLSKTGDSGLDRGRSSISLVEIDDCSDDDVTDVTSGIFGDYPDDCVEVTAYSSPAFKSLQKHIGTPDSMDSIDLPSTAGSSETLSPASLPASSSPKAMDSGYDTENNESPEFVLKEPYEPQDAKVFIQPLGKAAPGTSSDTGDPEEDTEVQETSQEDGSAVVPVEASQSTDEEMAPISAGIPYTDSAYFSDCDTENDRLGQGEDRGREDEEERKRDADVEMEMDQCMNKTEKPLSKTEKQLEDMVKDLSPMPETVFETDERERDDKSVFPSSMSTLSPSWSGRGECAIAERFKDEGLGLESHTEDVELSECCSTAVSPSACLTIREESSEVQVSKDVDNSPFLSGIRNETIPDSCIKEESNKEEIKRKKDESTTEPLNENEEEHKATESERMSAADTCRNETESEEGDDAQANGFSISPACASAPSPLSPLEGRVSLVDGEEADEEDGDSEDSDESDEELRTYSIQEQSEESDEEVHPVPIIVSDCTDAHKLRSLLKIPTLVTDSLCDDLESKKKVVSFFDDVTVYLFDQESPTRELAEHGFPPEADSGKPGAKGTEPHSQDKVNASDDSSDGNISEESAGYEWEDDFPLLALPTPAKLSPPETKPKRDVASKCRVLSSASDTKPVGQRSRFTVSPSSVSRFSITHVSDSDMDSAGGSSEDGERE